MQGALGRQEVTPVAEPTIEDFSIPKSTHQEAAPHSNKAPVANKEDPPKPLEPLTPLAEQTFNQSTGNVYEWSTGVLDRWLRCCEHDPHELDFKDTLVAHTEVYSLANYLLLPEVQALASKIRKLCSLR